MTSSASGTLSSRVEVLTAALRGSALRGSALRFSSQNTTHHRPENIDQNDQANDSIEDNQRLDMADK